MRGLGLVGLLAQALLLQEGGQEVHQLRLPSPPPCLRRVEWAQALLAGAAALLCTQGGQGGSSRGTAWRSSSMGAARQGWPWWGGSW